jgi:complement component 1 Q subcomponent-binding protein
LLKFSSLVDKELATRLKEEYQYEEAFFDETPELIESFLKEHGWSVQDQDYNMEILLNRSHNGEDIVVAFAASRIDESEGIDMKNEEKQGEEEREETKVSSQKHRPKEQKVEKVEELEEDKGQNSITYDVNEIPFSVTIKRQEEPHGLLFNCIAINDTVEIESLRYLPDHTLANSSDAKANYELSNIYEGPMMITIDDALQEAFFDFLEARGIDEKLVTFLNEYNLFKEQKEYIRWLKKIHKFVTKKA